MTEVLIPAGYVTVAYDPVYQLTPDGKRYVSKVSDKPTAIPAPGLPFSLVFRAEPGKEDVLLKIASAYEAASQRRVPPDAAKRRSGIQYRRKSFRNWIPGSRASRVPRNDGGES